MHNYGTYINYTIQLIVFFKFKGSQGFSASFSSELMQHMHGGDHFFIIRMYVIPSHVMIVNHDASLS